MKRLRIFLLFSLMLQLSFTAFAQENRQIVQSYLERNMSQLDMDQNDINNWVVTNEVFSKSTGITHVYIQQTVQGIPVHNAVANIAIKNNAVVHFANRLEKRLASRISGTTPALNPIEAVTRAAGQLNLPVGGSLSIINADSPKNVLISKAGLSNDDIPVNLVYEPTENGVKLAWDLNIHTVDGSHWWSLRVDAISGNIISKNDWVVSCTFPEHTHNSKKIAAKSALHSSSAQSLLEDGASYNVFAFPTESPAHGSRELLTNPADLETSPFGWHDTNGVEGPEYTITRGNNVYAQEDFNGNNGIGYSPDGGASLSFDFYYEGDTDPFPDYQDAAITNLFYVSNVMHDVWARYGFDEESGNFQQTNYSGVGIGGDPVFADALDGSGFNNANFATPPDGNNPRMQMYLWNPENAADILTINNTELAGGYAALLNSFDPGFVAPPTYPEYLTADLALMIDGTDETTDGCEPVTNPEDLAGKIAVVRRGSCNFTAKVINAQNAGAVAVLVVNNVAEDILMGGGDAAITIPAISINMAEGEAIIAEMENNTVYASITDSSSYLFAQDGDFDNGIISHEYGHGISNRLTGGASNANCLGNDEQMGEGWSDWFGLMLTMKEGDTPETSRGIGTYVVNQPNDGTGIRPAPYSTDFALNPYTYGDTNDDVNIAVPHGIGFVWATMLWDLTWKLVEVHGFDPDVYNGNGGNNLAMQLVIDGLKLQPCRPGFVDGRDAILAADMALTGGENHCEIWEVFANRGLGYSASQGTNISRMDQVEAFDTPFTDCYASVQEMNSETGLQIYPNPSKGTVNISSRLQTNGESLFNIYDMNGRLVMSKKIDLNNSAPIDANSLSTGVYVVKITVGDTMYTQKLLME